MYRKSRALIGIFVLAASGCAMLRPRRSFTWQLTLQVESAAANRPADFERIISVIERRLDAAGVPGFEVSKDSSGSDRLIIKLPNVQDRERLKNLITAGGKLEIFHVISPPSPVPLTTYDTKEKALAFIKGLGTTHTSRGVLPYLERDSSSAKWIIVEHPPVIDGTDLRYAAAVPDRAGDDQNYQISFSLNKTGADKFGTWTAANINEYIGIALNDEVKSAAYIKSQILDQGEINGKFTKEAAEDLALVLRSGALPATLKIVREESIK